MKNNEFKAGINGLPPIKTQYDDNDKNLIVEAAEKYGAKVVAEAYEIKWQAIASWKRRYKHEQSTPKPTPTPKSVEVIIQSPSGQEITVNDILEKVGTVDTVYIRTDENAAYWVHGEETGAIALW